MVRTDADEHLDNAKELVQKTIEELAPIIAGTCWGWDEYNRAYTLAIQDVFNKLLDLRQLLSP